MSDRNQTIIALHAQGMGQGAIARQLGVTRNVVVGVIARHHARSGETTKAAYAAIDRLSDNALLELLRFGEQQKNGNQWREIASRYRLTSPVAQAIYRTIKAADDAAHAERKPSKTKR